MTQIEFSGEEAVLLRALLEYGLTSIHTEIMHTSSFD